MYSERTEKVDRKREIDKLSKRITALSLFFKDLINDYEFWSIKDGENAKTDIDKDWPNYTWKEYNSL